MDTVPTQVIDASDPEALPLALRALRAGKPIVFPTDTVYGIGCDWANSKAIKALYRAKERPRRMAIPLLLAGTTDVSEFALEVPPSLSKLAAAFWPGALTVIVQRSPKLPPILTADMATVALRVPAHPLVHQLCGQMGGALAASSANISARPAPRTARRALEMLEGRVPLLIDGGETPGGTASTIIDLTEWPPRLLRRGPLDLEQLREILPTLGGE